MEQYPAMKSEKKKKKTTSIYKNMDESHKYKMDNKTLIRLRHTCLDVKVI